MNDVQTMLSVFKDHTSIVNTLWGILSTVALALLGFVYKEPELRNNATILAVLTVGFVALAAGNQVAITRSQKILFAVAHEFQQKRVVLPEGVSSSMAAVLAAHEAETPRRIRLAHTGFDFLVVIALWIPYLRTHSVPA